MWEWIKNQFKDYEWEYVAKKEAYINWEGEYSFVTYYLYRVKDDHSIRKYESSHSGYSGYSGVKDSDYRVYQDVISWIKTGEF